MCINEYEHILTAGGSQPEGRGPSEGLPEGNLMGHEITGNLLLTEFGLIGSEIPPASHF